jgi:hypothetical protein
MAAELKPEIGKSHSSEPGRRSLWLVAGTLAAMLVGAPLLLPAQAVEKPLETLQGTLIQVPDGKPAVKARGKEFPLSARSSYLLRTLEDKRLAGREVRIEGEPKPDGSFETWKFFTVRDGKLYRVRYYCEICNIEALEPGRCVCCQRPTELQEIPVNQPEP